jgi:glycosyltransferase involved in cell wall biosynthesis
MSSDPSANELKLTILMPCLNEAETLEVCIKKARRFLERRGLEGEVIVADNGSEDGSQEIASQWGARIIEISEKGYGAALLGGICAARGDWIIMGDADNSYDFSDLNEFVDHLADGADLVMGCRFPAGGGTIHPGAMPWKHRWLGNPVLSFIGRLFFRSPVRDFHCGLRAFRKQAIMDLGLRTTGMEFASEMVVRASVEKMDIREVPITLHPDGRSRKPHLRSWRDGWRHLTFLLILSPRWLFFYPGAFLTALGGAGVMLLWRSPFTIGEVRFDTNTLLIMMALVLSGTQLMMLFCIARRFCERRGWLPDKDWLLKGPVLEVSIGLGLLMVGLGLALIAAQWWFWREGGFGDLSYSDSLRWVIPGVGSILLGIQAIFSGFMFYLIDSE